MSVPLPRVTEKDASIAVLRVLAETDKGQAPTSYLIRNARKYLILSEGDLAPSGPRNGEPMWKQLIRNIISHREANFVSEGYFERIQNGLKITAKGHRLLKDSGF